LLTEASEDLTTAAGAALISGAALATVVIDSATAGDSSVPCATTTPTPMSRSGSASSTPRALRLTDARGFTPSLSVNSNHSGFFGGVIDRSFR
jgi:hypothetical protein